MFIGQCESDGADAGDGEDGTGGGCGGGKTAEDDVNYADDKTAADASDNVGKSEPESAKELPNKGTLIIDATCAPADIAYPTDLELCDKARSWTERIIDRYWRMYGSASGKKTKPRTYRKVARHRFLNVNKRRTKSAKKSVRS